MHLFEGICNPPHVDTDNVHLHALWSGLGRDGGEVRTVRVTRDHIARLRARGAERAAQVGAAYRYP